MTDYASFGDLRTDAVQAFVRTAILIDNEPSAEPTPTGVGMPPGKTATSAAFGARPPVAAAAGTSVASPEPPPSAADAKADGPQDAAEVRGATQTNGAHQLQVKPVTNAFAVCKITCGFYFPSDDEADLIETALAAARHVDATIVDWQLKTGDSGPARELIGQLILDDRTAGGRLRLIVVYTGERGLDHECGVLHGHLKAAGLNEFVSTDQGRALKAPQTFITFANKPARGDRGLEVPGPANRPVPWNELPTFVLESYGQLSDGLLQSFALKSIGAVRDDTHHLLSVFSPELDAAYLAQRAGIGTPSDAEAMMTSLLAAEFAKSIADRGIESEILGGAASALAIRVRDPPERIKVDRYSKEPIYADVIKSAQQGVGRHILADKPSLTSLVKTGLDTAIVELGDTHRKNLDRQFFSTDDDAQKVLSRFARLVTFEREVDPARRLGRETLNLTGGMILRHIAPAVGNAAPLERFMLCVQPGCDAVRLTGEVAFPFCPMTANGNVFDLVVRTNDGDKTFKVDRRPRALEQWAFAADDKTQAVLSTQLNGALGFTSTKDNTFWEFVAELRALEAQHFTTLLVGKFNRVALNSSEWLRLHRGKDSV